MGKHTRIFRHIFLVLGLVLLVGCISGVVVAQNVTQGYQTDQILQKGMIVRLSSNDGQKVEALSQTEDTQMLGVVVSSSDAPVSLSNIGVDKQVFVATYGRYDVLLSDQNGTIKTGDLVSISSLAGVGMKADSKRELVVGKALQIFDGKTNTEGKMELETSDGKRTVNLGRVQVEIAIDRNPMYQKDAPPGVPQFLSKIAQAVTDRPVTAFRIYASVGIMLLCLIVAGSVLFAGVRSGMIAVGRNPLAKHSIAKNLVQVALMALIVFVIGIIAVYLLLRV